MNIALENLLISAYKKCKIEQIFNIESDPAFVVERTQNLKNGHFASNIALVLAKPCKLPPRNIAQAIIDRLEAHDLCQKVEIAGPGFINFHIKDQHLKQIIPDIIKAAQNFGKSNFGQNKPLLIEFVSSNPTGPLHVGHGRSAASGATIANLLQEVGYNVYREYYVNDAGRQMSILAVSVWLRYLQILGQDIIFPDNGYKGDYVIDIGKICHDRFGIKYQKDWQRVSCDLPLDESNGGDKEQYIDAIIEKMQVLIGNEGFENFLNAALEFVLKDIKNDLAEMGVYYDNWFSEKSLESSGATTAVLELLEQQGWTYKKEGAVWFRSTNFGDDKDRVLIRANGQKTYFATDCAYHWTKYQRGFANIIDLFGSDHHGYASRIRAAIKAMGHDDASFTILLLQFAVLYRGKDRVQMSTRSGSFVTLRELRSEVGNDATRFFYVMRKLDQHVDFDLELAKSQSNENPVYYIQYAHARICSVVRQMKEKNIELQPVNQILDYALLNTEHELSLILLLGKYPELVLQAATQHEPHMLAFYLKELATCLHSYYNAQQILCAQLDLRSQRVYLILAVAQVIRNGLTLLGVSSPEIM